MSTAPGFFYWVGGIAVLCGVLGLIGLLALWLDHRIARRMEAKGRAAGTYNDAPREMGDSDEPRE